MLKNQFTHAHLYVFIAIWLFFSAATYLIVDGNLDEGPDHDRTVVQTTAYTFTGPMTGAISRHFQSCCLDFSLLLLPYAAGILAIGTLPQLVKWPFNRFARGLRLSLWGLGLFGWFMSGLLSFAHALE